MSLPVSRGRAAETCSSEGNNQWGESAGNPPTLDRSKEELKVPDDLMHTLRSHSFVLDLGAAVSEATSSPEEQRLESLNQHVVAEPLRLESEPTTSPSLSRRGNELHVKNLSDSFSLDKPKNLLLSCTTTLLSISPDVAALEKISNSSLPITPGSVLLPPSRQFSSSPLMRASSSSLVRKTSSFSSYSKCPPLGCTLNSSPMTPGLSDLTTQCTEDMSLQEQSSSLSLSALTRPPPGHPAIPLRSDSLDLSPIQNQTKNF